MLLKKYLERWEKLSSTTSVPKDYLIFLLKSAALYHSNIEVLDALTEIQQYEMMLGDPLKAVEVAVFNDFHWPLLTMIKALPVRECAERGYCRDRTYAIRKGLTTAEYFGDLLKQGRLRTRLQSYFTIGKQKPHSRYIDVMTSIVDMLSGYDFSFLKLFNARSPEDLYNDLVNIRGIGHDTAKMILFSLARRFGYPLPCDISLPSMCIENLKKIGLSEDDFSKEWLPHIDNILWSIDEVLREFSNRFVRPYLPIPWAKHIK